MIPAALTQMSTRPNAWATDPTAASTESGSVTSTGTKIASDPSATATSAPFDAGKSRIATRAPLSLSFFAAPVPSPPAPPVTIATAPSICISTFSFRRLRFSQVRDHPVDLHIGDCLLYTSDAADDLTRVDPGGRRIIN